MEHPKKIVFVTGTRADFGKLKSLMNIIQSDNQFELHVFVTGMHMLAKYGYTCEEVEKANFTNIYKFINQNVSDGMDHVLAKSILGLSDYVREINPDMIIVHGDRVEALAGATVGALNNVLTGHIEGGEVSGTIDELIRHAVTKLSHTHFVANNEAQKRLLQLGEKQEATYIIGSPDIDVMNSNSLPSLADVKKRYEIDYENYGVVIFHPVTTELENLKTHIQVLVDALLKSNKNYVVIYPNNDNGSEIIFDAFDRMVGHANFRIFPSMRFEHFLQLLKNADFMIGNSSAGVREAPHFGVPTINLGTRQNNRVSLPSIINVDFDLAELSQAILNVNKNKYAETTIFGDGNSAEEFYAILNEKEFWNISKQKFFVDLD
ncbi:UDP-N-acetylglucosamine 2-epimerase [Gammaproteobacteria bacterium]|mgnify:FL=1|nr:UDP-N-acetylglucosamine 2-epimerase [Gammaproteobacteria bacterium]MDC1484754.1 UDP-N-acetylglucosamine 2-epimerase [Gammaproteobacteria bacterium]|tara:strand:- start:860 stop:1990 length:1131 start_codon:yes stop_codon:yes gene_type:complete